MLLTLFAELIHLIRDSFLQVWDAILTRFPDMKVVWAHMGLSKELQRLHPLVHRDIMMKLFDK